MRKSYDKKQFPFSLTIQQIQQHSADQTDGRTHPHVGDAIVARIAVQTGRRQHHYRSAIPRSDRRHCLPVDGDGHRSFARSAHEQGARLHAGGTPGAGHPRTAAGALQNAGGTAGGVQDLDQSLSGGPEQVSVSGGSAGEPSSSFCYEPILLCLLLADRTATSACSTASCRRTWRK